MTANRADRWNYLLRVLRMAASGGALTLRFAAIAVLMNTLALIIISTVPTALGWRTTVVLSGSMLPRIAPGDVVACAPYDPRLLRPGQIIPGTGTRWTRGS